jgi:rhomboid family GlyGly-CTERM serine protease
VNKDLLLAAKFPSKTRWLRWSFVLLVAVACFLLEVGGDAGRAWGRYDRAALANGEAWRLLTGHLVHLGWGHLWPNLVALALIGSLFEEALAPLEWLGAATLAALAIDAGLYFLEPQVDWYVGLSGVLHGMVACGAWLLLGRGNPIGWLLAIGVAAKLIWEQYVGPIPFTEASAGGPVVVAAHLYGSAGGTAAAACIAVLRRRDSRL